MKTHTLGNRYQAAVIFTASKLGYEYSTAGLDWDETSERIARCIASGKFHKLCADINKKMEKT